MYTFYHEAMPNASGIYRITCIPTNKIYIGSAKNLRERRKEHFRSLQQREHKNPKLQAAWLKYGPDAFTFEIIELVLIPEMLTAREQYWFKTLKPWDKNGFNILKIAGSSLGRTVPQSSREKSRATQLGRTYPERRGKPKSPVAIERHRQSLTGYKHTEEARRNMGKSHEGSKRSIETRVRMSLSAMDHAPTNARKFILTSPDGIEYVVDNGLPKFCRPRNLSPGTMQQVACGNRKHHKGWKARYAD